MGRGAEAANALKKAGPKAGRKRRAAATQGTRRNLFLILVGPTHRRRWRWEPIPAGPPRARPPQGQPPTADAAYEGVGHSERGNTGG